MFLEQGAGSLCFKMCYAPLMSVILNQFSHGQTGVSWCIAHVGYFTLVGFPRGERERESELGERSE